MKHILLLSIFVAHALFSLAQSTFQYRSKDRNDVISLFALDANKDVVVFDTYIPEVFPKRQAIRLSTLDTNGRILSSFGYSFDATLFLSDVQTTSDKGFVLLGRFIKTTVKIDTVFVIKFDSLKQISWKVGFKDSSFSHNYPSKIIETQDKGFAFCGVNADNKGIYLNSYVVKLDKNGSFDWSHYYSVSNENMSNPPMLVESSSQDLFLMGEREFGKNGEWMIQINQDGSTQSSYVLNADDVFSQKLAHPIAAYPAANGGLHIFYRPYGSDEEAIGLVKTNATGNPVEVVKYSITDASGMEAYTITKFDNGYVVGGAFEYDIAYVAVLNTDLSVKCVNVYGQEHNAYINSTIQSKDGGYFIAANSRYDGDYIGNGEDGNVSWLIKTDSIGKSTCFNSATSMTSSKHNMTRSALSINNEQGKGLVSISIRSVATWNDWDSVICTEPVNIKSNVLTQEEIQLFPNPANETVSHNILSSARMTFYNSLGQSVLNTNESSVDVSELAEGIYVVHIYYEGKTLISKLLITK